MTRQALHVLVIVTGIALLGLVLFQVSWMGNILSANEQAFRHDVHDALGEVVGKLEKQEALEVTIDNFHTEFIYKSLSNADSNRIEWIESTFEKKVIEIQDYLQNSEETPEWVSFYFNADQDEGDLKDVSVRLRDDINTPTNKRAKSIDTTISNREQYEQRVQHIAKKSEYVQLAMHELFSGKRSIEDRVNKIELDSLIKQSLKGKDIDLDFQYAIYDSFKGQVVGQSSTGDPADIMNSDMSVKLFPSDVLGEAGILSIKFPEQQSYILGKVWATLTSSIAFILILLVSFGYAIRTIFRQKKLSEVKNDFINNMTHEFKTPISTVSLACEALRDEDVNGVKSLKEKYLGIIHDENRRLGQQVEKVLQMAVIDRNDFELKPEEVDVHQIIDQATKNINISISQRGGKLKKSLNAAKHSLVADRVHLTNMINNLLDNANKYSKNVPNISISTMDEKEGLRVVVEDSGIGISKENMNRIFDKFYRVPTGNLHDVKGFGLGLAYVKSMIEAHGGNISAISELKKGSRFVLFIPYQMEMKLV